MALKWFDLGLLPVSPGDGPGVASFKDRLRLAGRWNVLDKEAFPQRTTNELHSARYPHIRADWRSDGLANWEGGHMFGLVPHADGMLYKLLGDCQRGHTQMSVWLSHDGVAYKRAHKHLKIGKRILAMTGSIGTDLYIMGGQRAALFQSAGERYQHHRDAFYAPSGGRHWSQAAPDLPFLPGGMISGPVPTIDGFMWIAGGGVEDLPGLIGSYSNKVWKWAGIGYVPVLMDDDPPWPPRRYQATAPVAGGLLVVAGVDEEDENLADSWWRQIVDGEFVGEWLSLGPACAASHAVGLATHNGAAFRLLGNHMISDYSVLVEELAALGSSVALEKFGPAGDMTLSAIGGDSTYTATRTAGANTYGRGICSTAPLDGDFAFEIEPLTPTTSFNLYAGTMATKPVETTYFTGFQRTLQVSFGPLPDSGDPLDPDPKARLDFWDGGTTETAPWQDKLYGIRTGSTLHIYSGTNLSVAVGCGAMFEGDIGNGWVYFGAMFRRPGDSAKLRVVEL